MQPDNILSINGDAEKELAIQKVKQPGTYPCGTHKTVLVDSVARTVTCKECGFVIDPFDYLEQWANEGDRRMEGLKNTAIKLRIMQAEHDDLKRKVDNLRARLKRAGQPQPEVERAEYNMQRCNPHRIAAVE